MSNATTIDTKIVEMRFDNAKFEKNVKESITTLDELKKKLDFKESGKSLETLEKASENVKMDGMTKAIDKVSVKFDALTMLGISTFNKIADAAVDSAGKIVKAMSGIDNVKTGYSKYEKKTGYVQTLMNATGLDLDTIDTYLDRLLWFSDETSYSFTEMTQGLSTLLAAGADIDKMIPMIMGMANATAYAGKTAAEFQRVIYNLNQSYSQGALNALDWKSVEMAGVNSKALITALIEAGQQVGTLTRGKDGLLYTEKGHDVDQGTFRQTLADKWATRDVMEIAFARFAAATEHAEELIADKTNRIDTATEAYKAMAEDPEWADSLELISAMAAQSAKTWSEVVASVKDAVSTQWMKIMEAFFGDYEEAKAWFSELAEKFYDIFVTPVSDLADKVQYAMSMSGTDKFYEALADANYNANSFEKSLENILVTTKKFDEPLENIKKQYGGIAGMIQAGLVDQNEINKALEETKSNAKDVSSVYEEYKRVIAKTWLGDYGNNEVRFKNFRKMGYDAAFLQDKVDKSGTSYGSYGLFEQKKFDKMFASLTDAELEMMGVVYEAGMTVDEFRELNIGLMDSLTDMSGRDYFIGGVNNIVDSFGTLLNIISAAKETVLGDNTISALTDFVKGFYNATEYLKIVYEEMSEINEEGDEEFFIEQNRAGTRLYKIFESLFKIIRAVRNVFSSLWNSVKKVSLPVLESFSEAFDILLFSVSSVISKFSDWENQHHILAKLITNVGNVVSWVAEKILDLIGAIRDSQVLQTIFEFIGESVTNIATYVVDEFPKMTEKVKEFFNSFDSTALKTFWTSIKEGITNNIAKAKDGMKAFTDEIVRMGGAKLSNFPVVFLKFLEDVIAPLFNCQNAINALNTAISDFKDYNSVKLADIGTDIKGFATNLSSATDKVGEFLKGVNWGSVIGVLYMIFNAALLKRLVSWVTTIGGILDPVNKIATAMTNMLNSIGGFFKSLKVVSYSSVFSSLGIALLAVVGSFKIIVDTVSSHTQKEIDSAWSVMAGIIIFFGAACAAIIAVSGKGNWKVAITTAGLMIGIALAILMIAKAVEIIGTVNMTDDGKKLLKWTAIFIGVIAAIALLCSFLNQRKKDLNINIKSAGQIVLALAGVMLIIGVIGALFAAIKSIGKTIVSNFGEVLAGIVGMVVGFVGVILAMGIVNSLLSKWGSTTMLPLIGFVGALILLMGLLSVATVVAPKPSNLGTLAIVLTMIGVMMYALIKLSAKLLASAPTIITAGSTMLYISGALLLMAVAMKILATKLKPEELLGAGVIVALMMYSLGLIIKSINGMSATFSVNGKAATMLASFVGISIAIVALAMSLAVLSLIPVEKLIGPTLAMGALLLAFGKLMKSLGSGNWAANSSLSTALLGMVMVIGALSGALILLGSQPTDVLLKGGATLIVLVGLVYALSLAMQQVNKMQKIDAGTIASMLVGMAVIILAVAGVAFVLAEAANKLGSVSPETLLAFGATLTSTLLASVGLMVAASKFGAGMFNPSSIAGVIVAIGGVLIAVAGLSAILGTLISKLGDNSKYLPVAAGAIAAVTVALGAIGGLMYAASFIDPVSMFHAIFIVGEVMVGLFAAVVILAEGLNLLKALKADKALDYGLIIAESLGALFGRLIGGFIGGIAGGFGNQISKFGDGFTQFANGLADFVKVINQEDFNTDKIGVVNDLLTAISEMTGIKDLSAVNFSKESGIGKIFYSYAECVKDFYTTFTDGNIDIEKFDTAASIAEKLSNVYNNLPKKNTGEQQITADSLTTVGTSLKTFASTMIDINEIVKETKFNVDAFNDLGSITESFKTMIEGLPTEGGLEEFIKGKVDFDSLRDKLMKFAGIIVDLNDKTSEFVASEGLKQFLENAGLVTDIIASLFQSQGVGNNYGWLTTYGDAITKLGPAFKSFYDSVQGIKLQRMDEINHMFNQFTAAIANITSDEEGGADKIDALSSAFIALGNAAEFGFSTALTGEQAVKEAQETIDTYIGILHDIMISEDEQNKISDAFFGSIRSALEKDKEGILTYMTIIGKNLIIGLKNGINDKTYNEQLTASAKRLAYNLKTTLESALEVHSPSKMTERIGQYVGQGLAIGLDNSTADVVDSTAYMSENLRTGFMSAMSQLSDYMDNGINAEPTIRPVMDLSEIQNGAETINGMFGRRSYALAAGIGFNPSAASALANNLHNNTTINMTVNGSYGQSVDELADVVVEKLNYNINKKVNTWR